MRRLLFALTFSFSLCTIAFPQHPNHNTKKEAKEQSATYVAGMGSHHHPTTIRGSVEKCRYETDHGPFVIIDAN